MPPKIEKGLLSLAKKALAVITASVSSLLTANGSPIISNANFSSIKEEDIEKFQLKILKPQLVLKQNPNNLSEPFLSMHTSHRSHSSHSSHSSHVSSSSSGHYSHASHSSHASHYSSVPSYSPSNSVPYTPPATTSSGSYDRNTVVSSKQSTSSVPYRTLDVGCEGKDVETLQVLLGRLKYDVFPSGYYTQKTRIAVVQFQKDNKLTQDGKVNISTYEMIQKKASVSTFPKRVLEVGCEGKDVDSVQVLLKKLKYDVYPTGYFTEMTKEAVVQFQKDNQLTQNGKVDVRTFELIQKKYDELRFK